jgi:hypothetical protein
MYIFETKIKNDLDALVFFSGQLEGDEHYYGFMLQTEMEKRKTSPDEVYFIYPEYLKKEIESFKDESSPFYRDIIRYGKNVPVTVYSFDEFGKLSIDFDINNQGRKKHELDYLTKEISKQGLLALATKRKDEIILKAPPGTKFIKPSNEAGDEFIKASGLTVGNEENQFLAFCLLAKRPKDIEIREIAIDTASIAVFAESLIYYLYKFSKTPCKKIKYRSFGSYKGMEKAKPDLPDYTWAIISASTSNNMGEKLARVWGLNCDQVITVLSYTNKCEKRTGDNILINIASLSEADDHNTVLGSVIGVTMVGENFTAEISKPNTVDIVRDHKTPAINECIYKFHDKKVFLLNKKPKKSSTVKSIYVDVAELIKNDYKEELGEWLDHLLRWHTLCSLRWLAYDKDDSASVLLFNMVVERLPSGMNWIAIDLDKADEIATGDDAIMVLMPAISTGRSLLQLNRRLRISKHNGQRIFIVPFAITKSEKNLKKITNTLCMGQYGLKYQLLQKYKLYIGHHDEKNSWQRELRVIQNLNGEYWRKRESLLSKEGGNIEGHIGILPKGSDLKLDFSNGFVFWGDSYEASKVSHEAVYATISSVLQGLRELTWQSGDSRNSLQSHVYKHSVIDPDNFTKLNDSLLQACLWRAANEIELDYSSSSELSATFCSIEKKLINDYVAGKENSAIDLLMGIAIKKIKLEKNELRQLIDYAHTAFENDTITTGLVDYIINEFRLSAS